MSITGGTSAAAHKRATEDGSGDTAPALPAVRRGGRPPTLSRDIVLDAALEIAGRAPDVPVSISAVARSLNVTPMALYTYFANRDELMQALSARLLEGLDIAVPPHASHIERIKIWAYGVRRYCLDHPELLSMLIWEGGRSSAAWLNKSRPLFEAAEGLGFREEELGRMMLWLWSAIMSPISLEVMLHQTEPAQHDQAALDPAVREGVKMVHLATDSGLHHEQNFAFQMAQIEKALAALPQS